MQHQIRSHAGERLDFFIGNWQYTGLVVAGLIGPGGEFAGTISFRWAAGGKWQQFPSRLELPGIRKCEVQGRVACNNEIGKDDAYAVSNMDALMVYECEWLDESKLVFLHTHPTPDGRPRVVCQRPTDGSSQTNRKGYD